MSPRGNEVEAGARQHAGLDGLANGRGEQRDVERPLAPDTVGASTATWTIVPPPAAPERSTPPGERRAGAARPIARLAGQLDQRVGDLAEVARPQQRLLGKELMDDAREVVRDQRDEFGDGLPSGLNMYFT